MPDVDLKLTFYGFNREDGKYGYLHPRNQAIEVSFFMKIWTYELWQLIFFTVKTCV